MTGRAGEAQEPGLAGAVGREPSVAEVALDRGDVDNGSLTGFGEVVSQFVSHHGRRGEVDVDGPTPTFGGEGRDGLRSGNSGGVHEATKTTLGGASVGVGVMALGGIGHVKGRNGGRDAQFCG